MTVRIGINGFGRIGRLLARTLSGIPSLHLNHINDPAYSAGMAAHLLRYDSTHGQWSAEVGVQDKNLLINGRTISVSQERSLEAVGWGQRVDIVVDCSGRLKDAKELQPYLAAGVKKAVLSAPIYGAPNLVLGVNDGDYLGSRDHIVSAASCTTNCLGVVAKVLHEEFGISYGFITTIHAITNDQSLLDQAHSDWRRARTAGDSLIPTTSGFARTIGLVIPALAGRLDGYSVRAPVNNASLIDGAFQLEQAATIDSINNAFRKAAAGGLHGLLAVEEQPLVSADFKGNRHSAIVDPALTHVLGGHFLKLVAWYDNETGYVTRLSELLSRMAADLRT